VFDSRFVKAKRRRTKRRGQELIRRSSFALIFHSAAGYVRDMDEEIHVDAAVREKTHVGDVEFPVSVPERLIDWIDFPNDVFQYAPKMGLDNHAVKFLMAVLSGRWGLTAPVDLQDIAIKTGMQYPLMDQIVRDLLEKNYATLGDKLNLYRFWIVLLHLKGVRFTIG
jgi:hypothetical protein